MRPSMLTLMFHGDTEELADLLRNNEVLDVLHNAAPALWQPLDQSWDSWLRELYKATLGAAFFEAVQRICPRTTVDALNLELTAMHTWDAPGEGSQLTADVFWITESTLGGSGFVEEFVVRYAEDPRRFFRFLDAALYPSDLEVAADDLGRIVEFLASESSTYAPVQTAVSRARLADSHEQSVVALKTLRVELSNIGILPNPTLMISLNARLLRPGFTRSADLVLDRILRSWRSEEQRLGIDIDARVIAFVKSFEQEIDTLAEGSDGGRSWRYGVLLGMLWARGAQIRGESLKGPESVRTRCSVRSSDCPGCKFRARAQSAARPNRLVLAYCGMPRRRWNSRTLLRRLRNSRAGKWR